MLPTLITYSNYGYKDFAYNLLINLSKKCKNHSIDFYCLDKQIYEFLKSKDFGDLKVTYTLYLQNISSNFNKYNDKNYVKLTHTKTSVIKDALNKYNFVHFIDCDVVCINEPPEEFYEEYKDYDIVFQYDCGPSDSLFQNWTCTGNTSIRNTSGALIRINTIEDYQSRNLNKNDQECLHQFFIDVKINDIREDKHCKNYVYPIEKYTNGYMVKNNLIDWKNTYFFHANHVVGSEEKIKLLKKVNEWYL
jgi:hypothetical protein